MKISYFLSPSVNLTSFLQTVWLAANPGKPITPEVIRWINNLPDEADLAAAREVLNRPDVSAAIKELNEA